MIECKHQTVIGQATAAPGTDRQQASKTTRRDGVNKAAKKTREVKPSAPDTDKLKATFYLESAAADALEVSWMKLRRLAGDRRGRVSKSALVELALLDLAGVVESEAKARRVLALLMARQR